MNDAQGCAAIAFWIYSAVVVGFAIWARRYTKRRKRDQ